MKKVRISYILLFIMLFMTMVMLIDTRVIKLGLNNHEVIERRTNRNRRHSNRRLEDEQSIASNETVEKESSDNGKDELPPCGEILLQETTELRCDYANKCDGEFLMQSLLPLVFCTDPSIPSSLNNYPLLEILFPILFPTGLVLLTLLLFRLLSSTAENYFSPALEMLSSEFQIPPALAGVTLLALGNGAPDISAVVNAIKTNAQEGIPLSLGELTGGGMFVQSVVVGRIVMLGSNAGGITCGKELIRDISMYVIAAGFVFWMIERGRIHYRHVVTMLLLYFGYVTIVVISELRRYNNTDQIVGEEANDIEAEILMSPSHDEEDQAVELAPIKKLDKNELPDPPGSMHSSRVLRVIKRQQEKHYQLQQDKRKSLSNTGVAQDQCPPKQTMSQSCSLDLLSDTLNELREHLHQTIHVDIISNKLLSTFEWHCMLMEIPFIVIRKFVIPIPCLEEYNRSMVAFSIAFSPLWVLYYLSTKLEAGIDGRLKTITIIISFTVGASVIRFCDKATVMPLKYGIVVALYGFLIAATWIDVISDHLVNVLELIGILLRIPSPVLGMTILAWGNSVGDWTTNGALAQRGLADMR
jgi:sodium/potassium/calcium exchanger 6